MAPAPKAEKARSKAEKSEKKKQEKSAQRQVQQPVVKRDRPVVKPTEQQPSPLPFLVLDSQQMASADIGRMAKEGEAAGETGQGNRAVRGRASGRERERKDVEEQGVGGATKKE